MAKSRTDAQSRVFREGARILSEAEAVRFQENVRRSRDEMLTSFFDLDSPDSAQRMAAADAIIATKGWVTEELFWRERSLAGSKDAAFRVQMDSLQSYRTRLAGMYLRIADTSDNMSLVDTLASLTGRIDKCEQRLARQKTGHQNGFTVGDGA